MDEHEWVFHSVPIEELCKSLDTNIKTGLSSSQAEDGNDLHGANVLTPAPTTPEWVKLGGCLLSGPSLPLWLGAVPCFVAYGKGFGINHLYLGASLSSIVTMTGIYSYYQGYKLNSTMEDMKAQLAQKVVCRRDGEKQEINADDLTLGDIVYVKAGDIVPADIRILESHYLKVDNSSITGETEPQTRSPEFTHDNLLETKNVAFYSTCVVEGSGVGMVVNIGDETMYGQIANTPSASLYSITPVSQNVDRFLFRLSGVTVCVGAGLCVAAYVKKYNWLYPIIVGLGLLPAAMYASINAGIQTAFSTLAQRKCLVKDLYGLSTLGAIDCICTDMTGVITQNKMTVAHVWLDNKIEASPTCTGDEWPVTTSSSWKMLERAAVLCNSAEFKDGGEENVEAFKRPCVGNEIDAAILRLTAATTNDNVMEYRGKHKKVCEILFKQVYYYKFQVSIYETMDTGEGEYLVVMKGAPENILERCTTVCIDGENTPINQQLKTSIETAIKELAGLGERVIAFCDLILPLDEYPIGYPFDADEVNWPLQGFRFLGLMAMIDPPRAAVPDAVYKLRRENIKLVMVTGDHPATAKAIAKSVGIISQGNQTVQDISERLNVPIEDVNPLDARAAVVLGSDLKELSMDSLNEILMQHTEIVFARLYSPRQKMIIVEAFQSLGCVVAVTGSEIGDAPALKTADLGIAMGLTGTDAAKNAADMILMDDNFANIVSGVEATKKLFRRRKCTVYFE